MQTDRRRFLTATLAPAIAAGRRGPNDRIRVAVVGFKRRGRDHIRCFHELAREENVEIAALCDIDESVLDEGLAYYQKLSGKRARRVIDLADVLADPSIDAVSYSTPNHWHALGAIWACQAGKDVYLEKPASHTIHEGRKMIEAARKFNRIIQHGTQCRSNPAMQEGVRKLREGLIGEVYMARGMAYKWRESIGRIQEGPVPPGVHYDLWIGPAPLRPFAPQRFHIYWHYLWDYGNGEIGNQGVHQLDIMRWGLGLDTHPARVQSMGGRFVHKDDQQTPNTQIASYEYQGRNLLLQFDVRHWITNHEAGIGDNYPSRGDGNVVGVIFYGSDGYMVMPDYSSYYTFLGRRRKPGPKGECPRDPGTSLDHFRNFLRAMRSRKHADLSADIVQGHLSAALAHLAGIAYRTGRTLRFDPEAENFPNDEEANRLLTRTYRAPYVLPGKI
ncbi:MAG: Gfo/Idh/MocA family protein [Bryobacteraceae bacterium]